VTKFDYDPWGRQTKLVGTQDAAFGYAGYFAHQPSGLLLTWYRAYDVNQARWISRDPIGEFGGINLYAYVSNYPVGETDPEGLKPHVPILRKCTKKELEACTAFCASQGKTVLDCSVARVPKLRGIKRRSNWDHVDTTAWLGSAPNGCVCNDPIPPPCPGGRRPGPTNEEQRLLERSARYKEEFWKWILIGDYALWVVGTAGAGALSGAGAAGRLAPVLASP